MSFLGIFLYKFLLIFSFNFMPTQEAFIINYTWPLATVFFGWLILKDRVSLVSMISLLVSFFGVVIVATGGRITNLYFDARGVFSVLAGAFFYGLYSVLSKKQSYDKYLSVAFFNLFAVIYSGIYLFATSSIPSIDLNQTLGLLWIGIFPSGLAYVFWLLAVQHGNVTKISNLIFITPFLSIMFSYFWLGEEIKLVSIFGLVVIVTGILIQSMFGKTNKVGKLIL
jgi:drug/metabolite transporter (DMT)-like permease